MLHAFGSSDDDRLGRAVVETAGLSGDGRLLALGVGRGALASALAHAARELVARDAAAPLPFPAASFDAACISLLRRGPSPEERAAILHEASRVTKPGGTIAVVTRIDDHLARALEDAGVGIRCERLAAAPSVRILVGQNGALPRPVELVAIVCARDGDPALDALLGALPLDAPRTVVVVRAAEDGLVESAEAHLGDRFAAVTLGADGRAVLRHGGLEVVGEAPEIGRRLGSLSRKRAAA